MSNTCKSCRWFDDGVCSRLEILYVHDKNPALRTADARIEFHVLDDSGLDIQLRISPEFGCFRHEVKS